MNLPDIDQIKTYLLDLQDKICAALAQADGSAKFTEENWVREEGGGGRSRVMVKGAVFEQAGVNFSHVSGAALPASATAHRPELAGRSFQALGVSLWLFIRIALICPPVMPMYAFLLLKSLTKIRCGGLVVALI